MQQINVPLGFSYTIGCHNKNGIVLTTVTISNNQRVLLAKDIDGLSVVFEFISNYFKMFEKKDDYCFYCDCVLTDETRDLVSIKSWMGMKDYRFVDKNCCKQCKDERNG